MANSRKHNLEPPTTAVTDSVINPYARPTRPSARSPGKTGAYQDFDATELYCPRCRRAVPVRKHLLLVLPEGDKYEYLCAYCSETVGTKVSRGQPPLKLII